MFDLLDGQQRVTTLSLLFNEIYRELVEDEDYEELALEVKSTLLDFDSDIFTATTRLDLVPVSTP